MTSTQNESRNDFLFSVTDESFEEIERNYDQDDIARRRLEEFDRQCDLRRSLEDERRAQREEDNDFGNASDDSEDRRLQIERRIEMLNEVRNRWPTSDESNGPLFSDEPLTDGPTHTELQSERHDIATKERQRQFPSAALGRAPSGSDNDVPTFPPPLPEVESDISVIPETQDPPATSRFLPKGFSTTECESTTTPTLTVDANPPKRKKLDPALQSAVTDKGNATSSSDKSIPASPVIQLNPVRAGIIATADFDSSDPEIVK